MLHSLISYYFQSRKLFSFVIKDLQDLPERSLPQTPQYLVPVCDMVVRDMQVRTLRVIVAKVASHRKSSRPFQRCSLGSDKVDTWVVENFTVFVGG